MSETVRLSEPKRVTSGLFNADEYAEIERRRARLRDEAHSWLSARFKSVRAEEIGDRLADAVRIIQVWEQGCMACTGVKCSHSRAVLEICEEYRGGFRSFVVRARPCGVRPFADGGEA